MRKDLDSKCGIWDLGCYWKSVVPEQGPGEGEGEGEEDKLVDRTRRRRT